MRSFAIEEPGSPVPALYATLPSCTKCNETVGYDAGDRCVWNDWLIFPKRRVRCPRERGPGARRVIALFSDPHTSMVSWPPIYINISTQSQIVWIKPLLQEIVKKLPTKNDPGKFPTAHFAMFWCIWSVKRSQLLLQYARFCILTWFSCVQVMMRFDKILFYIYIQSLWEMRYYLKLKGKYWQRVL